MALEQKRPLPAWLKNVQPATPPPPRLTFGKPITGLVNNHSDGVAVSVTPVENAFGTVALLFRTTLNEDTDGNPRTYAPPKSAADHSHLDGLSPIDHINNATNEKPPTFVPFDPKRPIETRNTWLWAGVVHMTPGDAANANRRIDDRAFLRDHNGTFPVFNRADTGAEQFYAPQTAIAMATDDAVDPIRFPYAALSARLRDQGDVRLGDFGLAIRASTGAISPFLYADAGGGQSTSVGECSRKLIRNLFDGPATAETICYVVFPDSRHRDGVAQPELMERTIRQIIHDLAKYDNADELPDHLAESLNSAEEDTITRALNGWGLSINETLQRLRLKGVA